MKIQYDKIADAMYVYLSFKKKIAKTIEINDRLLVDVDKKGNVVGIEMLNISAQSDMTDLKKIAKEGIPFRILTNSAVTV
ncbi:MAG: hypothetical protein A2541_02710 [Candidatus Taylorbacteria bacterium RIFOXYD2_FULL_36_9]|uniref:DUF2283 domain-containing protein n=1 Tax=Candidatus Taylorbacteria bacterium RIFOXYD2_FULL_36_9 TaxID=1802338 RepID=A0A1G2PD98_9BACT|nr:MAG: hypothetical protein A2541_02710 [Candidatus Taylorbacteria bacterium RIFOXYD2_FULL_36_9]